MLNMYMGYAKDGMEDGAVLIFAHTSKEARYLAYKELQYMVDCEFIEARVFRLWGNPQHLLASADKKKYENDKAHVIDDPGGCSNCCLWGEDYIIEENGQCIFCNSDDIAEKQLGVEPIQG